MWGSNAKQWSCMPKYTTQDKIILCNGLQINKYKIFFVLKNIGRLSQCPSLWPLGSCNNSRSGRINFLGFTDHWSDCLGHSGTVGHATTDQPHTNPNHSPNTNLILTVMLFNAISARNTRKLHQRNRRRQRCHLS